MSAISVHLYVCWFSSLIGKISGNCLRKMENKKLFLLAFSFFIYWKRNFVTWFHPSDGIRPFKALMTHFDCFIERMNKQKMSAIATRHQNFSRFTVFHLWDTSHDPTAKPSSQVKFPIIITVTTKHSFPNLWNYIRHFVLFKRYSKSLYIEIDSKDVTHAPVRPDPVAISCCIASPL